MIQRIAHRAFGVIIFLLISFILKAQLSAKFTANFTNGCSPLVVRFTDQSTGNPTKWKWDLGNGTTSFLQNPSSIYFNAGAYNIKLIVSNGKTSDTLTLVKYIKVFSQPSVDFIGSVTAGCYPLPVQFTDKSSDAYGKIADWQWDFGDGFSSTLQNPAHTYTSSGSFNVTLHVRNSNNCENILSKSHYINISAGVKADFSNSNAGSCTTPFNVNFTNLSTGTSTLTSKWLFGDGAESTQTNPSHTYTTSGSFTVKLIVTNTSGCTDTIIKPNIISAGIAKATFSLPDIICTNNLFVISNTSAPIPQSYKWTFGDGTFSTAANPVKKYLVAGIYKIKLVADFGGCLDSITKSVTVNSKPTANFNATVTSSCTAPFTVNFLNTSKNDVSWQWSFGDNTSSNWQTPSHVYTKTGTYTVQLIVKNASGCSDTISKQNFIKIQQPIITLNNLPDSGCVPFTKNFSFTCKTSDSILNYKWNFGDGGTSSVIAPMYTYNTAGVFTVSLIITTASGCKDTIILKKAITTSKKPVTNFTATPRNTCAHTAINFSDISTGNPNSWYWQFGDNAVSSDQNPTHTYSDTGNFTIQLITRNGGCSDTLIMKDYIHINAPIAIFIVNMDCKKHFERSFTDRSLSADQWNWDFGDGSTSNLQNPSHIYAATGIYQVSLHVINNASGCDYTTTNSVEIIDVKTLFTMSGAAACKGGITSFNTAFNLNDVVALNWDFGDGTIITSTTNNATHIYSTAGNYQPKLITTNKLGCTDSISKSIKINGPAANFIFSSPGGCIKNEVVFKDQSVSDGMHPIQTYNWSYGDGNSSTQTSGPFSHTYTTGGNLLVTLKVTDNIGCSDSLAMPLIISKPIANFNSPDTLSCPKQNINFNNLSTGPNLSYVWQFGDGQNGTIQNPIHSYTVDGSYAIKLIITDQYGCIDSITKLKYINIFSPVANFKMSDSIASCPPLNVQFTNLSTHTITTNWDFGDGTASEIDQPSHFYTYPGIYKVNLTVTSAGGCSASLQKTITIDGPKGTFTYNPIIGCNPLKVNFTAVTTGVVSMIWDFNDGNILDTKDSLPIHTYINAGNYLPKVILINNEGCHVPIKGIDTILVNGISPDFTFSTRALCDTESICFYDNSVSNDLITGYKWNFDDGNFGTGKNVMHSYVRNGFYYPQIVVTTKYGCVDSMKTLIPVKVVATPQIKINASPNGCTPLNVIFKGEEKLKDTAALTWKWTFVNGQNSTLQEPAVQTYLTAGISAVSLVATNSSGCKDSVNTIIEAYLVPTVNAGIDSFICKDKGIFLQASGAIEYSWSPAKGLNCTGCASPKAQPDSITTYTVIGSSIHGCTAQDSVKIEVKYPFTIKTSPIDTICVGQSRRIFVNGGVSYIWTPALSLNNNTIPNPVARPDTSTNYRVIVQDEKKCFSDTGFVFIKVYPIPTVVAGENKTINIGQTYNLTPKISADVTEVQWLPVTGIISNTYPGITIKPITNTDYTISVKNPGGCRAEDRISIFVICNGANVFMPNTFSPNGDGVNDIFYPRGTGIFKIRNLRIYNRWGQLVFENNSFNANDASMGWNGTFKGAKLNADVFDYTIDIICENNSVLIYKGNIALIQ